MDTYLESCFDAIGIFLCIHIVHRYRILMHKRSVPALDKYVKLTSKQFEIW